MLKIAAIVATVAVVAAVAIIAAPIVLPALVAAATAVTASATTAITAVTAAAITSTAAAEEAPAIEEAATNMVSVVENEMGSETTAAESDMTPLFRAVNPTELNSIVQEQAFSNPDTINGQPSYFEGKYFSLTEEGANSYLNPDYSGVGFGPDCTVVRTNIATSLLTDDMNCGIVIEECLQ